MSAYDTTTRTGNINGNDYKKRCKVCGEFKPSIEFYKHPSNSDGLSSLCRSCHKTEMKTRYRSNPEPYKVRSRNRDIVLRHDPRHKLSDLLIRIRSRIVDVPCSITLDYLHGLYLAQRGLCKLTGRVMTLGEGINSATRDAMSIDRVQPELGYVEGNVQLVTHQANVAKNKFDDLELISFCQAVVDTFVANPDAWGVAPTVTAIGVPTRVEFSIRNEAHDFSEEI